MTGLEKILSQISSEAQQAADETVAQAKAQAQDLVKAAEEEGKAQSERIAQQAQAAVKDILSRAESAAALQKRREILQAKQEIIRDVIQKAKESLSALGEQEYFDIIVKLVKKNVLPQQGEILFSEADLKRLPQNFEETLNRAVADQGASLTVSRETRPIDGGFVLAYGGVEENCSFTALFDASHEILQDRVHALLFSETRL